MVEMVTKFKCEVCGEKYDRESEAAECEAKGLRPLHPIGLVFRLSGYEKIIFAVIKQQYKAYHHHHAYSTWACRDTPVGDNAGGEDFCGVDGWNTPLPPDKRTPAYKRMVAALKKAGIKPIAFQKEPEMEPTKYPTCPKCGSTTVWAKGDKRYCWPCTRDRHEDVEAVLQ